MRAVKGPMAYADIINGLEKALEHDGAISECGTEAGAIKLVQRMNQYRILDRKRNHDMRMKVELPAEPHLRELEISNRNRMLYLKSRYDALIIRRFGSRVVIERRPEHPWISFTDLAGNPIDVPPYEVLDPIDIKRTADDEIQYERIQREIERESKRPTIPGGTTQAPRPKFDQTKPLGLTDDED